MAQITLRGNAVNTVGDLPEVGTPAPAFTLTGGDLGDVTAGDFAGKSILLNIFPSVDTGVCAASVRAFNERAGSRGDVAVLNVSADLPFAQARFCGAEGIDDVQVGSAFRSTFGQDYGVQMADGGWQGMLARSVVVLDTDRTVLYTQLTDAIGTEPDYDAAVAALS